eukprot:SAG25_NODE_289_length_10342_cov_5.071952_2_plen_184_part_00
MYLGRYEALVVTADHSSHCWHGSHAGGASPARAGQPGPGAGRAAGARAWLPTDHRPPSSQPDDAGPGRASTSSLDSGLSRRLCVVSRQSAQGRFLSFAVAKVGNRCHPLGVPALAFRAQPASGRPVLSPVVYHIRRSALSRSCRRPAERSRVARRIPWGGKRWWTQGSLFPSPLSGRGARGGA